MNVTMLKGWKDSGGDQIGTKSVTIVSDGVNKIDAAVPNAAVDQAVSFTATRSKLRSVFLYSATNATIKTNSSGSPTDTITLLAGDPIVWTINDGLAKCPFSADVTSLFVSNSSGSDTTIQVRTGQNS